MIKSILSKINKFVSDVVSKITDKQPWYKYYDKGGKIEYPNLTIYELIEKTCNAYPNNYALEYYGKRITYRELLIKIKRTASSLLELGVKDSKKMSDTEIKKVVPQIIKKIPYHTFVLNNKQYNELYNSDMNMNKMKAILHNKVLYESLQY